MMGPRERTRARSPQKRDVSPRKGQASSRSERIALKQQTLLGTSMISKSDEKKRMKAMLSLSQIARKDSLKSISVRRARALYSMRMEMLIQRLDVELSLKGEAHRQTDNLTNEVQRLEVFHTNTNPNPNLNHDSRCPDYCPEYVNSTQKSQKHSIYHLRNSSWMRLNHRKNTENR